MAFGALGGLAVGRLELELRERMPCFTGACASDSGIGACGIDRGAAAQLLGTIESRIRQFVAGTP